MTYQRPEPSTVSWSGASGFWRARILRWGSTALACWCIWCRAVTMQGQGNSGQGVTYERILNSGREPQN